MLDLPAAGSPADPNPSTALFVLRGVNQERGGTAILRDISLELPRTRITALVGPSGAGKTSLIRLLNRLDDPVTGEVTFDGRPLPAYPIAALRRRVGFVFQTAAMFPGTVADNLRVAVELGGTDGGTSAPDFTATLATVGLAADYATRDATSLSGGEQQRVSIARALMTRPQVLLLDEPTSALDPEVAARLLATIAQLSHEHAVSVVMVTHRLSEARHVSTYTVMLEAGRVVEAGDTARLFSAAATERARAYFATVD
jgi:UDP-glucose/iron transport system ATP-binding protein